MIQGIIFDMDGTVIDSNHEIYDCWIRVLKDKFNKTVSKKEFGLRLGMSGDKFAKEIFDILDINYDVDKIWQLIREDYMLNKSNIELKKGIVEVLELFSKKYKIAIATGAPLSIANHHLETLNIKHYFKTIIAGDMIEHGKPHPDIFLKAATELNVKPTNCVVIEDALMGLIAARKANMKVVMVEDEFTKFQDHSKADFKILSLLELPKIIDSFN